MGGQLAAAVCLDSRGCADCEAIVPVGCEPEIVFFGVCLVFLGNINKWLKRLVKRILQRVIIFTSGIFFAAFEIPEYTRRFILWNPILHAVELFRYAMNNEYPIPGISLSYLVWCSLIVFGFSLILYRTNELLLLESDDE